MNILEQRGGGFLLVLRSAPYPRLRSCRCRCSVRWGLCAGFPSPADDHIEEIIDLNELLVRNPPATFYIRAVGVSMIRVGIMDGDILVVDRSEDRLVHGDIVVACLDNEFNVKTLRIEGKGGNVAVFGWCRKTRLSSRSKSRANATSKSGAWSGARCRSSVGSVARVKHTEKSHVCPGGLQLVRAT